MKIKTINFSFAGMIKLDLICHAEGYAKVGQELRKLIPILKLAKFEKGLFLETCKAL